MVGLAALGVAACISDPEVGGEPVAGSVELAGTEDPCRANVCGANAAMLGGVELWQLDLLARPDGGDVRITGVHRRDGAPMRLRLAGDGDRLVGVDPATGAVIAERAALEGTKLLVSAKLAPYEITVKRVAPGEQQFWVGAQLPIETYELWSRSLPGGRELPLCSRGARDPSQNHAMAFGGDLYDRETLSVTTGPSARGWVNIACANSARYKMHKIGHTSAAQARLGIQTTLAQRRAMFNAWTGNVCGTGEVLTRRVPITVRESLGLFESAVHDAPMSWVEAIWDEHGAVCLDDFRLEQDGELLSAACGGAPPSPCSALTGLWTTHGHVQTGRL